jgi:hypothetical protein
MASFDDLCVEMDKDEKFLAEYTCQGKEIARRMKRDVRAITAALNGERIGANSAEHFIRVAIVNAYAEIDIPIESYIDEVLGHEQS